MSGIGDKTVKGLAPQSWTSVLVWAVLVVIFVSAPSQATKLVVEVVGGTGRWVAYTAFADCGTEHSAGVDDGQEVRRAGR